MHFHCNLAKSRGWSCYNCCAVYYYKYFLEYKCALISVFTFWENPLQHVRSSKQAARITAQLGIIRKIIYPATFHFERRLFERNRAVYFVSANSVIVAESLQIYKLKRTYVSALLKGKVILRKEFCSLDKSIHVIRFLHILRGLPSDKRHDPETF